VPAAAKFGELTHVSGVKSPHFALTGLFASLRLSYRTGIVSNSFAGARQREQAAYGFEDLCDTIVYSHEVGCVKPDPRIYEIALIRLFDTGQAIRDLRNRLEGPRR
jgi:FMN phosphatase YigB (HAD superfamily)